jgi:predicted transcriptional regulator
MENELIKELESKFLSQSKFSNDIEELVKESGLTYIESIVTYCDENIIEIESVSKLISKPLKERLRCEAMQLNYLKKSSRAKLPL